MYTIYADDKLLYSPRLFNEGHGVFSPKLTVELGRAGSLEYIMPPNNLLYDGVTKLKTIISVFQNDEQIFRGRVLHDEKDFYKQKKTYCEGELAFLLDSHQRPYAFYDTPANLFRYFIEVHNAIVNEEKQFVVGQITIESEDEYYFENLEYSTTLDEINHQLVDSIGGFLKTRTTNGIRYIDWLVDDVDDSSQIIEFGTNLLDLTEYITAENIITVLIPIGSAMYDEEGNMIGKLDITSANNGYDYVENETASALFGRIEGMYEWPDVEDPEELKLLGEVLLDNNIQLSVTLNIKAIDLHLLNVNIEKIRLGDWVRVLSIPHGLDDYFQCSKIVYDLVDPDNTEYIFGHSYTTLTDKQVNDEKTVMSTVTGVQSAISAANSGANKANQAAKEVETVIATLPTEYVKTEVFESYKAETEETIQSLTDRIAELEGGTA